MEGAQGEPLSSTNNVIKLAALLGRRAGNEGLSEHERFVYEHMLAQLRELNEEKRLERFEEVLKTFASLYPKVQGALAIAEGDNLEPAVLKDVRVLHEYATYIIENAPPPIPTSDVQNLIGSVDEVLEKKFGIRIAQR